MKFYEYHDDTAALMRSHVKKDRPTRDEIHRAVLQHPEIGTFAARHVLWESAWVKAGRPYYDLYPGMIEPFAKLNLDIKPSSIKPPGGIENLLIRFPEHPENKTARTMFMAWQNTAWDKSLTGIRREPFLCVGGDFGERDDNGLAISSVFAPPPDDSRTMGEWLKELAYKDETNGAVSVSCQFANDQAALLKLVRIACCLCLLNQDPDIITPQVLNRDADKVQNATPEQLAALAAKARANGRYGFSVGAKLETVPHIRRPHPAVYHTGPGRLVPVIKFRKGSVVKRKQIAEVPTGFLGGGES